MIPEAALFTPEPPPSSSQAPALGQWIERAAALDLLAAVPGPLRSRIDPFVLREARSEDSAAFADLVLRNQGVSAHAGPLVAALVGRPRWHVYVASEGARVVAAGALFVLGDVGYLGLAATEPEQRGRGAQSA